MDATPSDAELFNLAKELHFEEEWVWYGHHPCGSNTYSKAYIELGRFKTIAAFWQYYNSFPSVEAIHDGTAFCNKGQIVAYSLFRTGIRPEWEDPVNIRGSEWGCRETLNRETFKSLWDAYMLAAIGEHIPHCVGIRAINKSNRSRLLHKLEVWMDKTDTASVQATRHALSNLVINVPGSS